MKYSQTYPSGLLSRLSKETNWAPMVAVRQLRILIADDSEILRDSMRALIGPLEYAEIERMLAEDEARNRRLGRS